MSETSGVGRVAPSRRPVPGENDLAVGGARLSRQQVVVAALELIDADGTQNLTMRSLGQHLGTSAMSLYGYVTGREDILEAVVARLLEGFSNRLDDNLTGSWQGYLQNVAHQIRKIAVEHPNAFPLVATRHPAASWLRPPLRSIEMVESFLSTLAGYGFSDQKVVEIYRAFSSFLLGQLLLESAARGAETSPVEEPLDEGGAVIPNADGLSNMDDAPTVLRMQALLSEDRASEEFEMSLETLLDRLELTLSQ